MSDEGSAYRPRATLGWSSAIEFVVPGGPSFDQISSLRRVAGYKGALIACGAHRALSEGVLCTEYTRASGSHRIALKCGMEWDDAGRRTMSAFKARVVGGGAPRDQASAWRNEEGATRRSWEAWKLDEERRGIVSLCCLFELGARRTSQAVGSVGRWRRSCNRYPWASWRLFRCSLGPEKQGLRRAARDGVGFGQRLAVDSSQDTTVPAFEAPERMTRRRSWQLATGNWQLATGNWQLATGNWQLATGNWQLATGNWQLAGISTSSYDQRFWRANGADEAMRRQHRNTGNNKYQNTGKRAMTCSEWDDSIETHPSSRNDATAVPESGATRGLALGKLVIQKTNFPPGCDGLRSPSWIHGARKELVMDEAVPDPGH
ncbi:hypothetical protein CCM_00193 [Cordyceps militaris CM01]|uniref:Uncharacterized protein n=1 Tax=Cordyceps militaris (strain CM01) TaxID=983644 RepID=G3J2K3_CORMM|nr:uncharacterized protein CCM_00193 [Cordyceps militaris CM01]EGX95539.1 hypothetical protein CCM_00193 [Cordyceps militaris CM01]